MSTVTCAWFCVQRDGRDPPDLHAAEDHGRARVEALAGPREGAAQLVVAGEVAVGQAHERDRAEDQAERGRPG